VRARLRELGSQPSQHRRGGERGGRQLTTGVLSTHSGVVVSFASFSPCVSSFFFQHFVKISHAIFHAIVLRISLFSPRDISSRFLAFSSAISSHGYRSPLHFTPKLGGRLRLFLPRSFPLVISPRGFLLLRFFNLRFLLSDPRFPSHFAPVGVWWASCPFSPGSSLIISCGLSPQLMLFSSWFLRGVCPRFPRVFSSLFHAFSPLLFASQVGLLVFHRDLVRVPGLMPAIYLLAGTRFSRAISQVDSSLDPRVFHRRHLASPRR
jgi:hypothetical protein